MTPFPFLIDPAAIVFEHVTITAEGLTLHARSAHRSAACPTCHVVSERVHSRYRRRPRDLPWQGLPVRLDLVARRFFCENSFCAQRIFCERLEGILAPFARTTERLQESLQKLALTLSGEAGKRLALTLGIPVSADTLLRRARHTSLPVAPEPHVIGVDDWAYRKGRRYGTIIVDLERHKPIDVLPDRTAETLAAWLRARPSIEIVARDRSPEYSDAITRGAPHALQVADRWHVLKNLSDAAHRLLTRHTQELKAAKERVREHQERDGSTLAFERSWTSSRGGRVREEVRERNERLHQQILSLRSRGFSQRMIARELDVSRGRVVTYLQSGPPTHARARRGSILDRFVPYLHARYLEGCRKTGVLYREIQARGYGGGKGLLRRYLKNLHERLAGFSAEEEQRFLRATASFRLPPVVQAARWLLRFEEHLTPEQIRFLEELALQCPEAAMFRRLGLAFRSMMRERDADALPAWVEAAMGSGVQELKQFALGIQQDFTAVEAGLRFEWSNAQVEGQVTRLKFIKRQMYGRAGFDLLRARVLAAA